jgi:hypothetical protein
MAMKNLFASPSETFLVVSSKDDALAADFTAEEYAAYLKDLDLSKLRRAEGNDEPFCFFHLRSAVSLEDALRSKDRLASIGMVSGDAEKRPITAMTKIVQAALVDVTVGEASVFEKDKDGGPSERLMRGLVNTMAVIDLFTALQMREAGPLSSSAVEATKKN